jgi:hypothetical protein
MCQRQRLARAEPRSPIEWRQRAASSQPSPSLDTCRHVAVYTCIHLYMIDDRPNGSLKTRSPMSTADPEAQAPEVRPLQPSGRDCRCSPARAGGAAARRRPDPQNTPPRRALPGAAYRPRSIGAWGPPRRQVWQGHPRATSAGRQLLAGQGPVGGKCRPSRIDRGWLMC